VIDVDDTPVDDDDDAGMYVVARELESKDLDSD
jgi:hypothetical protein